ncbi:MAG: enolase [Planctomycetes bacterium]|nr:enolase [Planctomycetota bacterium]
MKIKEIEIIWLDVPFHEIPDRNMARQNWGWRIVEVCRVTTDNGIVGVGETLPNYTWGKVSAAAIERAKGCNPFEIMWDDSLGAGLQMAILDICGKAAEVPVYRLLGTKVRDRCPISWWGIDMSPEDYAAEAGRAFRDGYMSAKQKARPAWWDVFEQAKLSAQAVPRNFKFDYDFNCHLLTAANAIPVLEELDKTPNIVIYEEPIFSNDVEGNKRIRQHTRCPIALHYGADAVAQNVREEMCDGYVVGGGISAVMHAARVSDTMRKMFWLQLVGTAWTTTMMLHLGAVCKNAQWPAVTCMNMYEDTLVTKPLKVRGGFIEVPETPGLGIEFNEAALKYRVNSPDKKNVEAVYAIVRDNGHKTWFHGEYGQYGFWDESHKGNLVVHEQGIRLHQWKNDGSKEWKEMAERLKKGTVSE